jgi:hypothetical protein
VLFAVNSSGTNYIVSFAVNSSDLVLGKADEAVSFDAVFGKVYGIVSEVSERRGCYRPLSAGIHPIPSGERTRFQPSCVLSTRYSASLGMKNEIMASGEGAK